MGKILRELSGHSGSTIYLMEDDRLFVRKINNVERNYERMTALKQAGYPVPEIYSYDGKILDMQYIRGLDMKNYLIHNGISLLFNFLCDIIDALSDDFIESKDYNETYRNKLSWMNGTEGFNFTADELIRSLPRRLPRTMYHGDMTLENILYTDPSFCFIDPLTSEYDSYIFDIAKLRQDLECKWFIRNTDVKIDTKLQQLQDKLKRRFPEAFDDDILILMLMRVYPYCDEKDKQFIVNEANRLWK